MKAFKLPVAGLAGVTIAAILMVMAACELDQDSGKPVYYPTLRFQLEDANAVTGKFVELKPKRVFYEIPKETNWSWSLLSRPESSEPVLINPDSATLKFLADLPGRYQLELTGTLPGQLWVETLTLYAYDVTELRGSFQPVAEMDQSIHKLYQFQDKLYVGGEFIEIGAKKVNGFATYNKSNWFDPKLEIDNDYYFGYGPLVNDIIEYQGDLYISGYFNKVNELPASGIARWDGTQWMSIPGIVQGQGEVMKEYYGDLYILGQFQLEGLHYGIIKWDGHRITGLASPFSISQDLEVYNNQLYVTGYSNSAEILAVLNGEQWNMIKPTQTISWMEDFWDFGGADITVYRDQLFINLRVTAYYGDEHTSNYTTSEVVVWDGEQFQDLGRPFSLKPGALIYDMVVLNDMLYIHGNFNQEVLGTNTNGLVTWDGRQWGVISDGSGVTITAMQEFQDKLYLGLFGPPNFQLAIWQQQ